MQVEEHQQARRAAKLVKTDEIPRQELVGLETGGDGFHLPDILSEIDGVRPETGMTYFPHAKQGGCHRIRREHLHQQPHIPRVADNGKPRQRNAGRNEQGAQRRNNHRKRQLPTQHAQRTIEPRQHPIDAKTEANLVRQMAAEITEDAEE